MTLLYGLVLCLLCLMWSLKKSGHSDAHDLSMLHDWKILCCPAIAALSWQCPNNIVEENKKPTWLACGKCWHMTGWWYTYPSEKWWSSSVGTMTFPRYGKIKFIFQTTNQYMVNPIIHRVSTIQGGSGFLPSTVSQLWALWPWLTQDLRDEPKTARKDPCPASHG